MGTWENEQIFQGNLGSKWILGSISAIILREQSKNILGIREILEIFLGNTGIQIPLGGPQLSQEFFGFPEKKTEEGNQDKKRKKEGEVGKRKRKREREEK